MVEDSNTIQQNLLNVIDLSSDGRGVVRLPNGRVIMIPNCLPNDQVSVDIKDMPGSKPDYRIESMEIAVPSPDRIVHVCDHAEQGCRGSILGALEYQRTLKLKQKQLGETLKRIGKLDNIEIEPIIPSENTWNYRDRIELKVVSVDNSWRVAFTGSDGDVRINSCKIATDSINPILTQINSRKSSPEQSHDFVNRLLLRDNGRDSAIGILYVEGRVDPEKLPHIAGWLNSFGLKGWQIRETKLIDSRFTRSKLISSDGDTNLYIKIGKRELIASPSVFTQANSAMIDTLIKTVLKSVPPNGKLLDLYGGYGPFAIDYAISGGQSTVVEAARNSITAGRTFCSKHALKVKYLTANLNQKSDWMRWKTTYTACVVDPPRAGLSATIRNWLQVRGAKRLIYVSCHPAALARDLKLLTNYKVSKVQPIDMFPQTVELETVVVLDRK